MSSLSPLDPEFVQALSALGLGPLPGPEVADEQVIAGIRKICDDVWIPAARAIYEPQLPKEFEYRLKDYQVPVDGGEITVRTVVPTPSGGQSDDYPLLVYFHSGGVCAGNLETNDYKLRVLAVKLNVVTVNVDYRLTPENAFPIPMDDCYAATKWAASNASMLSANPKKGFLVWGQSAGGLLAAITAVRARDDAFFDQVPLTGQGLQVPSVCDPVAYPEHLKRALRSMEENVYDPGMTADFVRRCYRWIAGPSTKPSVSPLLTSSFAGLPPAFIQVCDADPLRDDGVVYGRLLREANVSSKIEVYAGVGHCFEELTPEIAQAKRWVRDVEDGIKWLLSE